MLAGVEATSNRLFNILMTVACVAAAAVLSAISFHWLWSGRGGVISAGIARILAAIPGVVGYDRSDLTQDLLARLVVNPLRPLMPNRIDWLGVAGLSARLLILHLVLVTAITAWNVYIYRPAWKQRALLTSGPSFDLWMRIMRWSGIALLLWPLLVLLVWQVWAVLVRDFSIRTVVPDPRGTATYGVLPTVYLRPLGVLCIYAGGLTLFLLCIGLCSRRLCRREIDAIARRGVRCLKCGYDLSGSPAVCPECGSPRPSVAFDPSSAPKRPGRRLVAAVVLIALLAFVAPRWLAWPARFMGSDTAMSTYNAADRGAQHALRWLFGVRGL